MQRVIAVSDSHGALSNLREVIRLASGKGKIDTFVFLGDGLSDFEEAKSDLLYHSPQARLITVRGNNDFGSDAPMLDTFSVYGRIFMATHGHTYRVKYSLDRLSYAARELNATIALYGHTHLSRMEEAYGIWMINPGAVCNASSARSAYAEILVAEDGTLRQNLVRWSGEPF